MTGATFGVERIGVAGAEVCLLIRCTLGALTTGEGAGAALTEGREAGRLGEEKENDGDRLGSEVGRLGDE
jgi:hypothetical protein